MAIGRLEEGAENVFKKKNFWGAGRGGRRKILNSPPNSPTVRFPSKNPERGFWDAAFVGAGSLKPERT